MFPQKAVILGLAIILSLVFQPALVQSQTVPPAQATQGFSDKITGTLVSLITNLQNVALEGNKFLSGIQSKGSSGVLKLTNFINTPPSKIADLVKTTLGKSSTIMNQAGGLLSGTLSTLGSKGKTLETTAMTCWQSNEQSVFKNTVSSILKCVTNTIDGRITDINNIVKKIAIIFGLFQTCLESTEGSNSIVDLSKTLMETSFNSIPEGIKICLTMVKGIVGLGTALPELPICITGKISLIPPVEIIRMVAGFGACTIKL